MEIFLNIVADEKGISPYEKIAVVNNLLITPENDIFFFIVNFSVI